MKGQFVYLTGQFSNWFRKCISFVHTFMNFQCLTCFFKRHKTGIKFSRIVGYGVWIYFCILKSVDVDSDFIKKLVS